MGREIRRVPPNWDHPKNSYGSFQPMLNEKRIKRNLETLRQVNMRGMV